MMPVNITYDLVLQSLQEHSNIPTPEKEKKCFLLQLFLFPATTKECTQIASLLFNNASEILS